MPPALVGELLDASSVQRWLRGGVAHASHISLCSAFVRSEALAQLLTNAPPDLTGRILVRWQLQDLLAQASDLDTFRLCKIRGLRLFMRLDFHGKVYSIPPHGIIVGSSNVTFAGLGLRPDSNTEASTLVVSTESNSRLVDLFFQGATEVTEAIVAEMREVLESLKGAPLVGQQWPASIMGLLKHEPASDHLLVSQCLWALAEGFGSSTESANLRHDLSLLGVRNGDGSEAVRAALKRSAVYRWFMSVLEAEGGEVYFGRLSALLQDSLMDDPAPNRRDVKSLLQCLLSWADQFTADEVLIDRPNHSQRVRLAR